MESKTSAMQCISSRIEVSLLKPEDRFVIKPPPVRLNLIKIARTVVSKISH